MRPRFVPTVLLAGCLAACGGDAAARPTPTTPPPSSAAAPATGGDARVDLAGRAAQALDHRFAALYTLDSPGAEPRSVVATVAVDGSWRVDIPGGALGGTADVSVVENTDGVFQCALASATNPVTPGCVRVAEPGKRIPRDYDPKVHRIFRQWLTVFTDQQAPLSVAVSAPLPGAQGSCYSIDSISASLKAPVDVGIYCYADSGLLTAARVSFGTFTLVSTAAAPASVTLPGPVTGGVPMPMTSPEPLPEEVLPSGSPSAPAG
ncbi:hypothetical protein [Jidongwangia harbinensis]|uniref:hypothetical protein n=1 Tax=Jidongwangia harbinensis TaxID=2878561 RepID=UPI001CD96AD3|nr:hypothetical protein [Jidongwangia harbinensis]MCA2215797.1 hypothetical protein [Jidongwangia harbinensis]